MNAKEQAAKRWPVHPGARRMQGRRDRTRLQPRRRHPGAELYDSDRHWTDQMAAYRKHKRANGSGAA
jgi:hypothetical protein